MFFQLSMFCGTYDKQILCGVRGVRGDRLKRLHINMRWRYNETVSQVDSFQLAALFDL